MTYLKKKKNKKREYRRNRHYNMPEEEKNKKREYEKNRYYTMLEEKNKKESMQEIDIT